MDKFQLKSENDFSHLAMQLGGGTSRGAVSPLSNFLQFHEFSTSILPNNWFLPQNQGANSDRHCLPKIKNVSN